ncbi:substrate-binding domain-containing protein [Oscillibacter sp.]|uniref:PstS family phosphate ABC transporter substrate-binding protein n=1 Tax=Oscillibacter sp. TaxID=1945593 RepID=UPI00289D9791|nr:substrate-binding domain-containing protein [Oscillibacter sp.]
MKKVLTALLATAMLLSLTACGSPAPSASSAPGVSASSAPGDTAFESSILFCGSTSLYPIISSLASSFTDEYVTWDKVDATFPGDNISIYVAPGGSGVGASAVIDGTCDFGMIARSIKDSEKEALGAGYTEYVVAKDALTVSVNTQNPLCGLTDDLSTDTIRQIFSGELSTWNEVDASLPSETINVYIRDLSGGAYEVFQKAIMGDSEVTASATQSASMTELATNIANDPWGIGYAGFGAYNKANQNSQVLFAMKVDGVEANEDTIISGDYTVQRPIMFVTGKALTPSQQAFVDYVFSDAGYKVVEDNGYIPAFTA